MVLLLLSSYRGTPLEVLHTILLGLAKYMLQFMPRLTNRMKEEVLARVNAFPCLAMCVVTIIPLWDGTLKDGLKCLFLS